MPTIPEFARDDTRIEDGDLQHAELYDGNGVCLDFKDAGVPTMHGIVDSVTCDLCLRLLVELGDRARKRRLALAAPTSKEP